MIIIVEGIDRVGKTTLCNLLSEELGYPIFKDSVFKEYSGTHHKPIYFEKLLSCINMLKCVDNIIVDRFHLTEFVYGHFNRHYINDDITKIDGYLSTMNCLLILVEPESLDRLEISSKEHGSSLSGHYHWFKEVFKNSRIKLKLNTDFNSFDQAMSQIKELING